MKNVYSILFIKLMPKELGCAGGDYIVEDTMFNTYYNSNRLKQQYRKKYVASWHIKTLLIPEENDRQCWLQKQLETGIMVLEILQKNPKPSHLYFHNPVHYKIQKEFVK